MHIIQPCCAVKHVADLRRAIGQDGTARFEGYGDLSLTELLPALLTRYSSVDMVIAAPSVPAQAVDIIRKWMRCQIEKMDGSGKVDVIRRLTIVSDLSRKKSPEAAEWLRENPWEGRLELVSRRQADTVILLPDLAIEGPVNMRYGHYFTATATADAGRIAELWKRYDFKEEKKEEVREEPALEAPAADAAAEPAGDASDE